MGMQQQRARKLRPFDSRLELWAGINGINSKQFSSLTSKTNKRLLLLLYRFVVTKQLSRELQLKPSRLKRAELCPEMNPVSARLI